MLDSRVPFVILAAAVILSLATSATYISADRPAYSYTINGFSCPFPQGVPAFDQSVVKEVAESSKFVVATEGQPYSLHYWSNVTFGLETNKNVTVQPPPALELGFATNGATTSCNPSSQWLNWIDVQVPFVNGTYNIAAESVHSNGGPK